MKTGDSVNCVEKNKKKEGKILSIQTKYGTALVEWKDLKVEYKLLSALKKTPPGTH